MAMNSPDIVASVLQRHQHRPDRLLQALIDLQDRLHWLPPEALAALAAGLQLPLARVRATASFYSFVHLQPMGRYRVLWSDNIIDRMAGGPALMDQLCKALWVEPGRVSEDGLVSVGATSCTGMGDQGPAALVNGLPLTRMDALRVARMAELIRDQVPLSLWPAEWFRVDDQIRRRDALLNASIKPGAALARALALSATDWLAQVERSGLRGRGGAGFPTARKWQACKEAEADSRYVVCNADEGEPGTFKDRVLLSTFPHLVFEGMTLAAHAVGARRGLLYLRGEYRHLRSSLEEVLAERRRLALLGETILGRDFAFDIEIHLGAGAYVCGEESALIESLEGKPGRPRIRPPFPVTQGYLDKPTTVNNVETLAAACLVATLGGDAYARLGTPRSAGTKLLSVSGDVARPGIYEYPFGVTVAQVLADSGATDTQAVQISGPSGHCAADDEFSRAIAFEDIATAGAFMVFDRSRDMFETARNFIHFFAHESCGFCTPCRVGTSLVAKLMDKVAAHRGSPYDLNEMFRLHEVMQGASHCGLGNGACNPLFDTLSKFRPAYERRLASPHFEPAFDLDAALSQARQMTGRNDAAAHLAEEKS